MRACFFLLSSELEDRGYKGGRGIVGSSFFYEPFYGAGKEETPGFVCLLFCLREATLLVETLESLMCGVGNLISHRQDNGERAG